MTQTPDHPVFTCADPDCTASIPAHRWAKTKAQGQWFFQRDGTLWCPAHFPAWVIEWRMKEWRRQSLMMAQDGNSRGSDAIPAGQEAESKDSREAGMPQSPSGG